MYKYNDIENKIINRFKYLNLKSIEVENNINSIISNKKIKEYDTERIYKEVSNYYLGLIKNNIESGNYDYLNTFIKEHAKSIADFKSKLSFLNKIISFLNMCEVNLTFEIFVDIINNNNIVKLIMKEILDKYHNNTDKINVSDDVKGFLEVYLSLYNVDENANKEVITDTDDKDVDIIKIYLNDIGKYPLLSDEEEYELAVAFKENNDREARKKLINSNLRLVVNMAKKYKNNGVDFLDIIEDGNIGLIKGIEKYDPYKGFRISTFVTWHIKQSIVRGLNDKKRTIRYPVHFEEKINFYNKIENQLSFKLGRKPTIEELSRETEFSPEVIKELEVFSQDVLSLNSYVGQGEDADTELGAFVKDPNETPEEKAVIEDDKRLVWECLELLHPKLKYILILRWGLYGDEALSLDDVADRLYHMNLTESVLTRERIRQLESKAMRLFSISVGKRCKEYKQKIYRLR